MPNLETSQKRPRLWTADFLLTLAIALFAFMACQALNNGTPLYIANVGGNTGYAGSLILVFSACAAIARLASGRIIDNMGRRRIMIFGAVLMVAGTVLAIPFPGLYPQIPFRAMQGFGFACVTTASSTAAADVLPHERLGEGIGYYTLGQSLGMAVGPAFGILLCSLVFPESLFVGAAGVCAVLTILVSCCNYEKHLERLPETSEYRLLVARRQRISTEDNPAGQAQEHMDAKGRSLLFSFIEKRAFVGAVPMLIICLGFAIPTSYTALYAEQCGFPNAGLFFLIGAIAMTLTRFLGGRLLDIVAPRVLFFTTVACGVVMFLMMAFAQNEYWLYASGVFFGISMGFSFPLLNSMAVKNTPPERWGAANAMFYLANDLGVGIGAFAWGFVADLVGFVPVLLGGAAMHLLSFVVAFFLFPHKRS